MLEWVLLSAAVVATAPLRLAIRADINRESTFEVVLFVYGLRMRFEGRISARGEVEMRRGSRPANMRLPLKRLFLLFRHLMRGALWSRVEADCRVGAGDALLTALAAGVLSALLRAAGAGMGVRVRVSPEFSGAFFALSLRCILLFRGGDIIRAGAKAFVRDAPIRPGKAREGARG